MIRVYPLRGEVIKPRLYEPGEAEVIRLQAAEWGFLGENSEIDLLSLAFQIRSLENDFCEVEVLFSFVSSAVVPGQTGH
jgi:hypothetical protein